MMELIRRQKWEKHFAKRDLFFKTKCREFYKNLKVSVTWKKEVAKSRVNGVEIEFDGMTLATILEIPENSGLCDYIKEEWEPSRYSNPLESTRKFSNDDTILEARRVKSGESESGEKFYDAEDEIQESAAVVEEVPEMAAHASAQRKVSKATRVDPSDPTGSIPDSIMVKLQAVFERARANRIQVDLEKAQAENARLLALLQQA
ncbi:hypothetical protein Dimus_020446 [Dionaea muscipula]